MVLTVGNLEDGAPSAEYPSGCLFMLDWRQTCKTPPMNASGNCRISLIRPKLGYLFSLHICMCLCICICVCIVEVHVYIYICVYVYVYANVYVYAHVCLYIYTRIHIYIYIVYMLI